MSRSIGKIKEQWRQSDWLLQELNTIPTSSGYRVYYTIFRLCALQLFDCSVEQINKSTVTLKRLLHLTDKKKLLGRQNLLAYL
jgi:hypothetical protein